MRIFSKGMSSSTIFSWEFLTDERKSFEKSVRTVYEAVFGLDFDFIAHVSDEVLLPFLPYLYKLFFLSNLSEEFPLFSRLKSIAEGVQYYGVSCHSLLTDFASIDVSTVFPQTSSPIGSSPSLKEFSRLSSRDQLRLFARSLLDSLDQRDDLPLVISPDFSTFRGLAMPFLFQECVYESENFRKDLCVWLLRSLGRDSVLEMVNSLLANVPFFLSEFFEALDDLSISLVLDDDGWCVNWNRLLATASALSPSWLSVVRNRCVDLCETSDVALLTVLDLTTILRDHLSFIHSHLFADRFCWRLSMLFAWVWRSRTATAALREPQEPHQRLVQACVPAVDAIEAVVSPSNSSLSSVSSSRQIGQAVRALLVLGSTRRLSGNNGPLSLPSSVSRDVLRATTTSSMMRSSSAHPTAASGEKREIRTVYALGIVFCASVAREVVSRSADDFERILERVIRSYLSEQIDEDEDTETMMSSAVLLIRLGLAGGVWESTTRQAGPDGASGDLKSGGMGEREEYENETIEEICQFAVCGESTRSIADLEFDGRSALRRPWVWKAGSGLSSFLRVIKRNEREIVEILMRRRNWSTRSEVLRPQLIRVLSGLISTGVCAAHRLDATPLAWDVLMSSTLSCPDEDVHRLVDALVKGSNDPVFPQSLVPKLHLLGIFHEVDRLLSSTSSHRSAVAFRGLCAIYYALRLLHIRSSGDVAVLSGPIRSALPIEAAFWLVSQTHSDSVRAWEGPMANSILSALVDQFPGLVCPRRLSYVVSRSSELSLVSDGGGMTNGRVEELILEWEGACRAHDDTGIERVGAMLCDDKSTIATNVALIDGCIPSFISILPFVVRSDSSSSLSSLCACVWRACAALRPRTLVMALGSVLAPAVIPSSPYLSGSSVAGAVEDPLTLMRSLDVSIMKNPSWCPCVLDIIEYSLVSYRRLLRSQIHERQTTTAQHRSMIWNLLTGTECCVVQLLLERVALPIVMENAQSSVVSNVCAFLHSLFAENPLLLKLVVSSGFDYRLTAAAIDHIPSLHICVTFLPKLLSQLSYSVLEREMTLFLFHFGVHLIVKYPLRASLDISKMILARIHRLVGGMRERDLLQDVRMEILSKTIDLPRVIAAVFPQFEERSQHILNDARNFREIALPQKPQ